MPSRSAAAMVARPIGRGERAAGRREPVTAVLDQDRDRDLWCARGRECDVPRVRRSIARVGPVLRGACLGCDLHAGDGSLLLRHLLGVDHQVRKCIGDLR